MAAAATSWEQVDRRVLFETAAKYLLLGVFLLLVAPVHNVQSDLWHGLEPWSNVAAVAAALVVLARVARSAQDGPLAPLRWPLLAYWLVCLLSSATNRVSWEQGATGFRAMLPWLTVGLSGATLFRFRDVPGVLRLASLTAVALAGYGVLSYLTFWGVGGPYEMPASPRNLWETVMLYPYQCGAYPVPEGWRLISTFMNDNYFGVWVAGLLPVTFAESALAERHYQRRLGYAGAALMVVACTWTYSRAAALALLTGIAVLVIRGHRAAILLLVPLVLVAPLFIIRNDVTRFTNLPATQGGRVQSLQRTTSALQQSPWLGKGPGSRGLADMNYAKIGYETGALGLAAFAVLLIQLLRPALKMSRSSDERSYLRASGILAGLLGTIAAAVGGEVWEMPQLAFTFWLMGGLLLILSDGVKPSGPTTRDEVVCVSLT